MSPSPKPAAWPQWISLAVFGLALAVRLLFWQATPDRAWPHSAVYKGDAVVWTDYATALGRGEAFEAGLPLRPPGNAYLLRWLGVDGRQAAGSVKLFWCLLGAAVAAVFHRAAVGLAGPRVGLAVGLWCALSTGLMVLSTSLNNETPYLLLVGLILLAAPRLAERPAAGLLVVWGALHGIACLMRVEHLLFALAAAGWLALVRWRADPARKRAVRSAKLAVPLALGFIAVLTPWHLEAWRAIRAFNHEESRLPPAGEAAQRRIEDATAGLRWTPEALAEHRRLPAFARRAAGNFVAATVLVRGGREVRAEDFGILEEAFGSRPRALPARPFVALYGPLNFYLANRPGAPPGFDPAGMDRRPPPAGGIDRYPRALLAGLPPRQLNFTYPPHVEVVTDGYRLGWRWIRADPGELARRVAARLDIAWRGAALGWTGRGLPFGLAGTRRAVDLTVPDGTGFAAWRWALLAVCLAGIWLGRKNQRLHLWLHFGGAKLVAVAGFFGYARHGATLIPVVATLAALAVGALATRLGRAAPPRHRSLQIAAVVAVIGLGVEAQRYLWPPTPRLDGREIGARDPFPPSEHVDRRVDLAGR